LPLTTADFDYDLPDELIAQKPLASRDESRLLHLQRSTARVSHHSFTDLADLLAPGDLLVMNDTRVVPAKFAARRSTGGKIDGLFLRETNPGQWLVMLRNAGRCKIGETVDLLGPGETKLLLSENLGAGRWHVSAHPVESAEKILERTGKVPLPPYIHRTGDTDDLNDADAQRYQTVYAARSGAVAAPTAGLHFTDGLLDKLADMGIDRTFVTLHVGPGTFLPVKTENIDAHRMHSERYEISPQAAEKLNLAKHSGRRIIAVGTTVVRVLESEAARGPFKPVRDETEIFLYPPADFMATAALITNFHLPKSTLLMLVGAFCTPGELSGRKMVLKAYQQAITAKYRFYSYGDAMFIDR